jgi:CHAD domain-containing protein
MAQWIVAAGHMKADPSQTARENARTLLPKMARRYFEAGRKAIDQKAPPGKLHAFRLETKRFRYTLELFRPLYGPTLERYLNQLRELQSALGKVSDYQAIQRVLASDRTLQAEIEHALRGKLKGLRQTWRAFDSDGRLKRWRAYLGRDASSPHTKRAKRTAGAPKRKAAAS